MCPDAELLSAYFDHEIPSPYAERLAKHVGSCPACQAKLAAFADLRSTLESDTPLPGEGLAQEAILRDLAGIQPGKKTTVKGSFSLGREFWGHSWQIPVPMAIAALLAVAIIPSVGVIAFSHSSPRSLAAAKENFPTAAPDAAASERAFAYAQPASDQAIDLSGSEAEFSDIDSLLRYLDSSNTSITVNIQLPAGKPLEYSGAPRLRKVTDQGKVEGEK
jgi:anti-sigma factor RsiW